MLARTWKVLRLWGVALVGGLALSSTTQAQDGMGAVAAGSTPAGCASCQQCVHYEPNTHCCPPHLKHYQEGPPKLCFKKACPKPICDPCELKHYGYYQTCWHPFPFPPDWSHCAAPPVGALLPTCCPHRSQIKEEKPADKKMPEADPLPKPSPSEGARSTQPPTWLPPARPETNTSPVRYQEQPVNVPSGPPGPPLTQTSAPVPAPIPVPVALPSTPPRPLPAMPEHQWTPPPPPPAREGPPLQPIRRTSLEERSGDSGLTQAVLQEPVPFPPPPPVPAPVSTSAPATTSMKVVTSESGVRIMTGHGTAPLATAPVETETTPERPRPVEVKSSLPGVRMVNSQQILLDFNATELTRDQRSALELWWTRDGKIWTRDATARFQDNAILTTVKEEGTFGFSVVQHQPDGMGPQKGDQPQMWVEADWNRPVVKLLDARFQRTGQVRQVALAWMANDRNLAQQPVALSYATKAEGPWTTFAPSVANSGRYIWTVPGHITGPVFVKVEAFDLMGNVGQDQSAQAIPTSPAPGLASRN